MARRFMLTIGGMVSGASGRRLSGHDGWWKGGCIPGFKVGNSCLNPCLALSGTVGREDPEQGAPCRPPAGDTRVLHHGVLR